MSSFSPTDAALEGVRLSRERPVAVLIWAASFYAITLILEAVADLMLGPRSVALLKEAGSANPGDFDKLFAAVWPCMAIEYPLLIIYAVAFAGSVYRTVLGGPTGPRPTFKIGLSELQLVCVIVVRTIIIMLFIFLFLFTVQICGIGSGQVMGAIGSVMIGALLCFSIFVWVRLSLSGAATCAENKILIVKSWPLTKGQFWRLVGAYLMATAIAAVALVTMALLFILGLTALIFVMKISPQALQTSQISPATAVVGLVSQALSCLIITCVSVIVLAPGAEAYRQLKLKA